MHLAASTSHPSAPSLARQVKELPPLKKRVDALHIDLELSKKSDEEAREALSLTRANLDKVGSSLAVCELLSA